VGENGGGKRTPPAIGLVGSATRFGMTLRSATKTLLVLALALPVMHLVFDWLSALLRSMGDDAGAAIVGHVGTAVEVLWPITVVALVIVLAVIAIEDRRPEE
jgi:hypothetical protein